MAGPCSSVAALGSSSGGEVLFGFMMALLLVVKLFPTGGHALQKVARRETELALFGETFHLQHQMPNSQVIGKPQGAAPERSKTSPHDHPKIDISRFVDDAFLQAAGRFVKHH